jgi:hypothetical protein
MAGDVYVDVGLIWQPKAFELFCAGIDCILRIWMAVAEERTWLWHVQ